MADPVTLGVISAVGTGISAVSSVIAGNNEKDAADKKAAMERDQANRIEEASARDIRVQRYNTQKLYGEMTHSIATSGADFSGSPLLALEEASRQMEEERQAMANEAAWKASQVRKGADLTEQLGSDRQTAGWLNATATVLTGGAKAYQTYFDKNKYPQQR